MNLIQRVQDILLRPKETWPVIASEGGDTASIYSNYLVYMAAIPAIAGFIGMSLIGIGGFGLNIRIPFTAGLVQMVVSYVLTLVIVFVMALIVDALAPTFSGTKNPLAALKLIAYGSTASFVAGVFSLVPSLGVLGLIASLYSVYVIYLGLPVLMRCPPEKAGAYTAVVIVCGIVAMVILGAVASVFTPTGARHLGGAGPSAVPGDTAAVTIKTPDGELKIDTAKLEDMGQKMAEAGKRMEAAQKSGDSAAAGKAMSEMMGAMGGATAGVNATPIPAQDLKALLPQALAGMKRQSFEAQTTAAMGIGGSSARATYGEGERNVNLSLTDLGGLGGLAALAGWANVTVDKETDGTIEKVYKSGNRTVHEEYRKDGSHGEYTVILANGVLIEAQGSHADIGTLRQAVEGIDLARIETMKRAAKP
ncbi:hypothetical protein BH11PSE8_BH11PSE8_30220 [soil metagenome]